MAAAPQTVRLLSETAYPPIAASARVRVANFARFLSPLGVSVGYRPMLSDDDYRLLSSPVPAYRKAAILAVSAARAALPRPPHDLLLVHRLRLLTPVPGIDPPRALDVYDLDDALFLGFAAAVNRRFQWAKQEASRCVACMRRARLVTVGSAYLADHAREYARRVEVVPSCVDPTHQPVREHADSAQVTIGWIGSHTTSAYIEPILPALAAINRDRSRARLILIGADPSLRADWIEHRPWSLDTEAAQLAGFDIGIMPLPDTEWARGKCGYKLLQYFAAGVPAVASPVGVNPGLIGTERGRLASTTEEWQAALNGLIDDVDERRERGSAAREFVVREYSYQRWAPELAAMLRELDR